MRRATILSLALLSAAAGSPGADRASTVLKDLPACAPVSPKRAGEWKDAAPGRGFGFAMPACYAPDDKPERRYVHGGNQWRCREKVVGLVWGMWGPSSYTGYKLCATHIGGVPAMVATAEQAKGVDLLAWYLTGTVHEPALSAWSPNAADLPEAQAIVYSGRPERSPE